MIIMRIGSNDLCHTSHPEVFADDLLAFATKLKTQSKTELVILGQILRRNVGPYMPTAQEVQEYMKVHLTARGQYKFYKSIRGAINYGLQHV